MNKKIKIIDLMQKCANKENIPERILYKNTAFVLNDCKCYYNEEKDERLLDYIIPTFSNLNEEVEILEDNTEEIEELNAYKLMESPYMANLLKEQRYDKFMELLKQSEVEIADKLIKLTWVVKEMRKEITNVNKNNIH